MYLPGKILYSGGAANLNPTTPAAATTATIDLTAATPQWTQTAPMAHARIYHTLTMLADGTVLAVGGEPTAGQTGQTEVSGGVLPSEIWNPSTQTWSPAAATGTTRGYHSTALLMPDGTVLVGGSGHANAGFAGQLSSQVYSPAYLSKGPRPTISSAPSSISYGSNFNVSMGDTSTVSAVNLVSLGSDTHQSDMDQHFMPLSFTQNGSALTIQAPSGGTYAPPGHYMLFILNANGVPAIAPIIAVTPPPTAPSAPTGVSAEPLNASAGVSWTAPNSDGATITSYTVTPYIGSVAQPATVVSGNPAPSATTVNGLTNGTTYTFTVTATNSVGTSPPSAASNPVTPTAQPTPAFVQQASAHTGTSSTLAVTLPSSTVTGDRLIVETGIWSAGNATAKGVTDSAGDKFTELVHYVAGDNTEQSVWSAPVAAGSAGPLTITVTPTAKADIGVAALEYSGLSTASDATALDQSAHAVGKTGAGTPTVASGATPATTGANELALGFYTDSGFGDSLSPATGYTPRVNISNAGDMEMLAEDQGVGAGATPNASVVTGASTYWLMSTLVFKNATSGQTAQIARALKAGGAGALAARGPTTTVVAPVTAKPSTGTGPTHVASPRHTAVRNVHCGRGYGMAVSRVACASLRHAAAIAKHDRRHWIYEALLQHLSTNLLCHWNGRPLRGALGLAAGWYAAL
jgi:hypothetical protein